MLAEAIITNKEKGFVFVCHCCTLSQLWRVDLFVCCENLSQVIVFVCCMNLQKYRHIFIWTILWFLPFYELSIWIWMCGWMILEWFWIESPNSTPQSSKHISNSLSIPSCTRLPFFFFPRLPHFFLPLPLIECRSFLDELTIWSSYFSRFLLEVLLIWSLRFSFFNNCVKVIFSLFSNNVWKKFNPISYFLLVVSLRFI
jgi:hypothetical protein